MPRADQKLRAEWTSQTALRYLEHRGYVAVYAFRWFPPKPGHKPTAKEHRALTYLADEWDWGPVIPVPPFNAKLCLAVDPFAGDETDVVLVADRIVTTRTLHQCNHCLGWISPRSHPVRARSEINREENKRMTFYFCPPCCVAMAVCQLDAGRTLERRYQKFKGMNRIV